VNVSAPTAGPAVATLQRAQVAAPKDADGDNDGTTRAAAAASKPAAVVSAGKVDGYV
jgi:hypothetical protein